MFNYILHRALPFKADKGIVFSWISPFLNKPILLIIQILVQHQAKKTHCYKTIFKFKDHIYVFGKDTPNIFSLVH